MPSRLHLWTGCCVSLDYSNNILLNCQRHCPYLSTSHGEVGEWLHTSVHITARVFHKLTVVSELTKALAHVGGTLSMCLQDHSCHNGQSGDQEVHPSRS